MFSLKFYSQTCKYKGERNSKFFCEKSASIQYIFPNTRTCPQQMIKQAIFCNTRKQMKTLRLSDATWTAVSTGLQFNTKCKANMFMGRITETKVPGAASDPWNSHLGLPSPKSSVCPPPLTQLFCTLTCALKRSTQTNIIIFFCFLQNQLPLRSGFGKVPPAEET